MRTNCAWHLRQRLDLEQHRPAILFTFSGRHASGYHVPWFGVTTATPYGPPCCAVKSQRGVLAGNAQGWSLLNAGPCERVRDLQALIANGPDVSDLDDDDDLLTRAAAFCKSRTMLGRGSLCQEHAPGAGTEKGDEHPLYWTQLHLEYNRRVETLLEEFLKQQTCSAKQFYATCKDCLERSRAERRWDKNAMFVQARRPMCYHHRIRRLRMLTHGPCTPAPGHLDPHIITHTTGVDGLV